MEVRIVKVGRGSRGSRQIATTELKHGEAGTTHAESHEHVTLATPVELTDTARLRLLTAKEAQAQWSK